VTGPMDVCHVGNPDRGGFGPQTRSRSSTPRGSDVAPAPDARDPFHTLGFTLPLGETEAFDDWFNT